ncbi:MAG: DNA-protecting protein DprA [Clostridiales bacterium]|jgi:predicted Rossmann fold nucleotide-binding protein DprA/Smf involved in DNA uptake|nr:DNA-protecting protein DprA [Clostridiales bacterium]
MKNLSQDSLAMLLLCSDLALTERNNNEKPFTLKEWHTLTTRLKQSSMERPHAFLKVDSEVWRKELLLTDKQVERIESLLSRGGQLSFELERLQGLGIWVTTRAEAEYPVKLKKSLGHRSPVVLYGAGDIGILQSDGIGIVGSRGVDQTGASFTQGLAAQCAHEELTVVSGGASGVDSIAQETALKSGGSVIAVLADSMESRIIKREYRVPVLAGKLLVLSSFNPKSHFKPYTAMERNKYIYTLANYVFIVSSAYNKGGTWSGAIENIRANWRVPMFVRSEQGVPEGNKKLLELGGAPIDLKDLLDNNISLREWLGKNKESMYSQQSLFDYEVSTVKEEHAVNVYDLFITVWPILEALLQIPRNEKEVAKILNVRPTQVRDWLNRAMDEGKVVKEKSIYFLNRV